MVSTHALAYRMGDARTFCAGVHIPRNPGEPERLIVDAEAAWRAAEARPAPATPVAVPTAAALAARTAARRALVAALMGVTEAALEAAAAARRHRAAAAAAGGSAGGEGGGSQPGRAGKEKAGKGKAAAAAAGQVLPLQVSLGTFLTAVRLESRLFARVRRVRWARVCVGT